MKKLLVLLVLATVVVSCERNDLGFNEQNSKETTYGIQKKDQVTTPPASSFVDDDSVDPKDIVPPRR